MHKQPAVGRGMLPAASAAPPAAPPSCAAPPSFSPHLTPPLSTLPPLCRDGTAKVGDVGMAKIMAGDYVSGVVGTLAW